MNPPNCGVILQWKFGDSRKVHGKRVPCTTWFMRNAIRAIFFGGPDHRHLFSGMFQIKLTYWALCKQTTTASCFWTWFYFLHFTPKGTRTRRAARASGTRTFLSTPTRDPMRIVRPCTCSRRPGSTASQMQPRSARNGNRRSKQQTFGRDVWMNGLIIK